ncbi:MAG: hypothetical protein ABI614_23470 [Planctomycetota bacterium]
MTKSRLPKFLWLAAGLVLAAVLTESLAQPPATSNAPAAPQVGDDEAGRLPPGYSAIVTRGQRAKIYGVQEKYQKEIDALQKQIDQIAATRDQEIESVLDEKQKELVLYVLKLREKERAEASPAKASATKAASGN